MFDRRTTLHALPVLIPKHAHRSSVPITENVSSFSKPLMQIGYTSGWATGFTACRENEPGRDEHVARSETTIWTSNLTGHFRLNARLSRGRTSVARDAATRQAVGQKVVPDTASIVRSAIGEDGANPGGELLIATGTVHPNQPYVNVVRLADHARLIEHGQAVF